MSDATKAECWICGARPGEACRTLKGPRRTPHAGRGHEPVKRRVRRLAEWWEPADLYVDQSDPATSPAGEGGTDGE